MRKIGRIYTEYIQIIYLKSVLVGGVIINLTDLVSFC